MLPVHDPDEVGSAQQFTRKLHRKFFPRADKPPPAFFQEIFDLVSNTCSVSTCKMDNVINLLESAYARVCTVSDDDNSISPSESVSDDDASNSPSESVSDDDDIRKKVIRYQALPRRYRRIDF